MAGEDVITNGYTDKKIDYDTYLATIYRLTTKNNNKPFID
jgi:hypothetical protein